MERSCFRLAGLAPARRKPAAESDTNDGAALPPARLISAVSLSQEQWRILFQG